ncbi:S-layer family protein [Achromobacter xylosoxidans]
MGGTFDNRARSPRAATWAGRRHAEQPGHGRAGGRSQQHDQRHRHADQRGPDRRRQTRITAAPTNLGRIYGDNLAIGTGSLVNDVGAGGAAVIAARSAMDLGATYLVNREHALIYSGRRAGIGGALDAASTEPWARPSPLWQNPRRWPRSKYRQRHHPTRHAAEPEQSPQRGPFVSSKPKVYFTPEGTTDMYDAETNWLCDEVTPMCSKDPAWLDDDPERKLLLPSTKYPADRYGPPFNYAPGFRDKSGKNVPIPLTYLPPQYICYGEGGDAGNASCGYTDEGFRYAGDARVWAVFGVTPPSGPMPVWVEPERPCDRDRQCQASEAARRQAYEDAYAAYKARHMELDARIREFNSDYGSRLRGTFTYYQVNETVTETRTLSTDPGKILSGGSMTLTGTVTNDKSQIAAGGALSVVGPNINNIGAGGERVITRVGTATVTQERSKGRKEYSSDYNVTLAGQPIELPVGTSGGNVQVSLSGQKPGATGTTAPGPVLVASVGLPGGTVVRTVSNPASIPDSQLFAVNNLPDAPYIVATDPRFTGQRPYVSSDYLFDLLRPSGGMPGAPTGNSVGAGGTLAGSRLGSWDALIPPGAKFLTPSGQPKRLGDGFYEQKAVSDQILATTGQRFLEKYSDNDTQYKALLAAGAKFAQDNGIKLGVALTEAQQRQLTTDLVWLVEQTVTLPDGTTETVLVPQVYLLVRAGDLKGDGTLLAGRSVHLAVDGNATNSGTIGAREATVITAGNIVNQAGGTIQGGSVNLAAREDLTNLVSLIKGDKVALSAGRDIALTSTSASENNGNTWGSHLTGVARVDAGSLNMQADAT